MRLEDDFASLSARNILVGEGDVVKIADFGLAKTLQGGRWTVDRGERAEKPIDVANWSIL